MEILKEKFDFYRGPGLIKKKKHKKKAKKKKKTKQNQGILVEILEAKKVLKNLKEVKNFGMMNFFGKKFASKNFYDNHLALGIFSTNILDPEIFSQENFG